MDGRGAALLQLAGGKLKTALAWLLGLLVGVSDSLFVGFYIFLHHGYSIFALTMVCFLLMSTYFTQRNLRAHVRYWAEQKKWMPKEVLTLSAGLVFILVAFGSMGLFGVYWYCTLMVQAYNLFTLQMHMAHSAALGLARGMMIPVIAALAVMFLLDALRWLHGLSQSKSMYWLLARQARTDKRRLFKILMRTVLCGAAVLFGFYFSAVTTSALMNGFLKYQALILHVTLPINGPAALLFVVMLYMSVRTLLFVVRKLCDFVDIFLDNGWVSGRRIIALRFKKMTFLQKCMYILSVGAIAVRSHGLSQSIGVMAGSPYGMSPKSLGAIEQVIKDMADMPALQPISAEEFSAVAAASQPVVSAGRASMSAEPILKPRQK